MKGVLLSNYISFRNLSSDGTLKIKNHRHKSRLIMNLYLGKKNLHVCVRYQSGLQNLKLHKRLLAELAILLDSIRSIVNANPKHKPY